MSMFEIVSVSEQTITLGVVIGGVIAAWKVIKEIRKFVREVKEAIVGPLYADMAALRQELAALSEQSNASATLVLAITKERLSQAHAHHMKQGELTRYQLASFCDLYEGYAERGGNGFSKTLMEDIKNLKIID